MHTHYGYDHDEKSLRVTHNHDCHFPSDHNHPDELLVIYYDEDARRAGPREVEA